MYIFTYIFASFAHSMLVRFIHVERSYGCSFSLLYTSLLCDITQFVYLF